jgi:hypothetical protein
MKTIRAFRLLPAFSPVLFLLIGPFMTHPCFGQTTDELTYLYTTTTENATSFSGTIAVANPNNAYAWNGSFFDINAVVFETSSRVTALGSSNGAVTYTQSGNIVSVNLGWQSTCSLGVKINLTVTATKQGSLMYPQNFRTRYVRGADIRYPEYAPLPSSWAKGKTNLSEADLIADPASYYDSIPIPCTATFIVYKPDHPTQIRIGQVDPVPYPVNGSSGVRIWVPTRLMAMGVGVAYEFFKINPNYMVGLGTKENFAAGIVPPSVGNLVNPVMVDGVTWYWPMIAHLDGPYQQESGNFNDCKSFFPDLFPPAASHDAYTAITVDFTNPDWISAGISSAISITVTREYLNAIFNEYNLFMDNAADPWAEFSVVDYTYNRGATDFLSYKLFSTNKAAAMASHDIVADFTMGGFASHVQTVRAITEAMNKALNKIYDAKLSLADMDILYARLRMFYGRGIPTDADWNAMKADVTRAFNVLARHWGGTTVSLRYDYLTLLRVIKQYLPKPYNPRPTGSNWYYQVVNFTVPTGIPQLPSQPNVLVSASKTAFGVALTAGGAIFSLPKRSFEGKNAMCVYTMSGCLVRTIDRGVAQTTGAIFWDEKDNNGRRLSPGLYFVRIMGLKNGYVRLMLTSPAP